MSTQTPDTLQTQQIHPSAIIGSDVVIAANVTIGPFCMIEGNVTLKEGVRLAPHVVIRSNDDQAIMLGAGTQVDSFVEITGNVIFGDGCFLHSHSTFGGNLQVGARNEFGSHNSIGHVNQDKKHTGPALKTLLGDDNRFFESVVIHCGSSGDRGITQLGSRCHVMDGAHIAHDAYIGDDAVIGNDVNFGGHVTVGNFAWVAAGSGIHQFCHIGDYAMIAAYMRVVQDVAPYTLFLNGLAGINVTGLKRQNFERSAIVALNKAFKFLFATSDDNRVFSERLQQLKQETNCEAVTNLVSFIETSQQDPNRRNCYTMSK